MFLVYNMKYLVTLLWPWILIQYSSHQTCSDAWNSRNNLVAWSHCPCSTSMCLVASDSAIPCTVAHRLLCSCDFSRQVYWSGWLLPAPRDLPERLLLNQAKTPGFLASGGEEFNLGREMRLDRSELLCDKVVLKYKGDRASDRDITRKYEEHPLASVTKAVISSSVNAKNVWRL